MTDTKLLETVIRKHGYKLKWLAAQIGLTYQGLRNKMDNKREFTASEISALSAVLDIDLQLTKDIFFASVVDKKSTNRQRKEE